MVHERAFSVGVHGIFATRICTEPATASALAALLTDPRWPWLMNRYEFDTLAPKKKLQQHDKALTKATGTTRLAQGFLAPGRSALHLMCSPTPDEVRATCVISTGRELHPQCATPYKVRITQRATVWPEHASLPAWLEVVHSVVATCRVSCGVIAGWPSFDLARSDSAMGGNASAEEQLPADYVVENAAVNPYKVTQLGGDMVGPPRWGTYLAQSWVDRIGGRAAIEAAAAPHAIRDIGGDVVFIQLTEAIESSQSAECEQKRLAFRELMRPILPPGIP